MLVAVNSRIVVKRSEEVRQTAGGIILQRDNSEQITAIVVNIGPEVKLDIQPGTKLIIDWRQAATVKFEGEQYFILDAKDVFALVKE